MSEIGIGDQRTVVKQISSKYALLNDSVNNSVMRCSCNNNNNNNNNNSSSRPADVFLPCWKSGRSAALDVTVVSPVQQLTINNAAVTQGHALSVAEECKRRLHNNDCHQAGISFIPLVVESLGGWSKEAANLIRDLGKLQAHRCGLPPSHSISHLFQRLSITLWRGNACMWASRLPIYLPLEDSVI